jgi:hypothetical protein
MRRSTIVVLSIAVVTAAVRADPATQMRPGAVQQAAGPADAFVLGQVVDASTGQGLAGALVTATGGTSGVTAAELERMRAMVETGLMPASELSRPGTHRVITDSEGRYLLRNLTRGNYSITVSRSGYAPGAYGRRRPDGPGRPLEVADSEKVTNATIRLWKFGAINGSIVDEAGEPAVGVSVRALRRMFAGGRVRFSPGQSVTTDDRGAYRIGSLIPGEYIVVAPTTTTTVSVSSADEYRAAMSSAASTEAMRAISLARMESNAPSPSMSGMQVGDHIVQASSSVPMGGRLSVLPPGPDNALSTYRTWFYPGTASVQQAAAITIGSGEERSGVDLALRPVPGARVSGVVTGPDGPAAGLGLRLVPADADTLVSESGFETAVSLTDASGRFTFLGVPAGQYTLRAHRVPRPEAGRPVAIDGMGIVGGVAAAAPAMRPGASAGAGPGLFAEMPISVSGAPITDLQLMLRTGPRVSGVIQFEGGAPRPTPQRLQAVSINLGGIDSRSTIPSQATRADSEGRFSTTGHPPGRYMFNVTSPGPEWTLKSVMAGGVNLLEEPLQLETDLGGVVVTFIDRFAEVSGSVQVASNRSDPDEPISILLFPADLQRWIAAGMFPRRAATTTMAKTGAFQMRVPVPGDYVLVAIGQDAVAELRPELYAALARVGTRVTIVEGEKKSLSLSLSQLR